MARERIISLEEIYNGQKDKVMELFSERPSTSKISIIKAYKRSTFTLNNYVTLDFSHRRETLNLIKKIRKYHLDFSRKRPLNYLMTASPGAGKSHYVKCLARNRRLNDICEEVSYNMANLQGTDDLQYPLEQARNIKVKDKLPILFLDEADTKSSNFAFLLPLLWDGEFLVGGRKIKIGKTVIIMAISNERILKQKINKMNDFLSRINGGFIKIPPLDPNNEHPGRQADKICIALSLLERRYGGRLKKAPWNVLHFIGKVEFKYGVRSIAYLIDQFPDLDKKGKLQRPSMFLNFLSDSEKLEETGFRYHIDGRKISTVTKIWSSVKNINLSVDFHPHVEE